MLKFRVEDMTCGHCASTITNAVREVDGKASIEIDLPTHQVRIESAADAKKIEEAIRDAGYTPVAEG
jgi:copper chaperone